LKNRTGSILLLTIWVLFFLAALVVASAGHVRSVLLAAERLQFRVSARMEAASVAAYAAAVIEAQFGRDQRGSAPWDGVASDAWNRDAVLFRLPGHDDRQGQPRLYFSIPGEDVVFQGIIGEEGRIHLNEARRSLLGALFAHAAGEQGLRVARTLFGLNQPDVDGRLTEVEGTEYDRPVFNAVEDLFLVEGMDGDLYGKLAPHLTVHGKGDVINVNSASRSVLVSLMLDDPATDGDAENLADRIIMARREQGFRYWTDLISRVPEMPGGADRRRYGFASSAFRGVAFGGGEDAGQSGLEIEFVWDTDARGFALWRER
jgi:hypothetical protein